MLISGLCFRAAHLFPRDRTRATLLPIRQPSPSQFDIMPPGVWSYVSNSEAGWETLLDTVVRLHAPLVCPSETFPSPLVSHIYTGVRNFYSLQFLFSLKSTELPACIVFPDGQSCISTHAEKHTRMRPAPATPALGENFVIQCITYVRYLGPLSYPRGS